MKTWMPCFRKEQYGNRNAGTGIGQDWKSLDALACALHTLQLCVSTLLQVLKDNNFSAHIFWMLEME